MKYQEKEKKSFVKRFQQGETVASICAEHNIPKSTFYLWISQFKQTVTRTGRIITPKAYDSLKRHSEKQENIIGVLKSVNCTCNSPLKDKLNAIEPLYGKYSVFVLCEALDIAKGTFYNHIFRNKRDNSSYQKHREELRTIIEKTFHENRQLFGADKIRAILNQQGYKAGYNLVAELMNEMGLRSIRSSSKKDFYNKKNLEKKENILNQEFSVSAPNSVWVSDVTCFKLKDKYQYICVIIDIFSRKVISYKVSYGNTTQLITATFKRAHKERNP